MKTFNARNVGTMLKPFVDLLLCSTKKSIGFDSVFGLFTLFFILFYFILFFYFIFFWGGGRGGGGLWLRMRKISLSRRKQPK